MPCGVTGCEAQFAPSDDVAATASSMPDSRPRAHRYLSRTAAFSMVTACSKPWPWTVVSPCCWPACQTHGRGCERLGITAPSSESPMQRSHQTGGRRRARCRQADVTRGDSARGYSPQGAGPPRVVAVAILGPSAATRWRNAASRCAVCKTALARNPSLAGYQAPKPLGAGARARRVG